jgi:hypothetical protein
MAKKDKAKTPNFPAAVLMRPRLDAMWQAPEWLQTSEMRQLDELDALVRGVAPAQYLPILLRAFGALEPAVQEDLAPLLVTWLKRRDDIAELKAMLEDGRFDATSSVIARQWLDRAGEMVNLTPQAAAEQFYTASEGADKLGSQGILYIAWYANRQRSRVRGCYFLIDYNPPWEGSIKDIMWYNWRDPEVNRWPGRLRRLGFLAFPPRKAAPSGLLWRLFWPRDVPHSAPASLPPARRQPAR